MLPSEHTMLNRCVEHLSSLSIRTHGFILSLKRRVARYGDVSLTPRQLSYLRSIYDCLVKQGVEAPLT